VQTTKEELVQKLRRQGKGFHQNSSVFRGVTKHQKGKWEARIGQVVGRKYKYLGLFLTEPEAAEAYDRAAVQAKGMHAVTNFEITNYLDLLSVLLTHNPTSPPYRHLLKVVVYTSRSALV
jgi:AP2-like factor, euAP2 lineage